MDLKGIVYTSNTGYTEQYAKMLGEKTGLAVYDLSGAAGNLEPGSKILYLGWLMAGKVQGYTKAAKKFRIRAVCGVGMGSTGSQMEDVRKTNNIPSEVPVFTLQGGFDISRLHGIYKFMMKTMVKTVGKSLAEKQDRTPDEDEMLDMLMNGGNRVREENLDGVMAFLEDQTTGCSNTN